GIKVCYLHSDIHTLQRTEIIRELRLGTHDVLVGVNLLREGLDIPEVSLVAILDADKEGFLRSERSLVQTIGRAARHINGQVLMYADMMTKSLRRAIDETNRRRELQQSFNAEHGITPTGIIKGIEDSLVAIYEADYVTVPIAAEAPVDYGLSDADISRLIAKLRKDMKAAADRYDFERAAALRDRIFALQEGDVELGWCCAGLVARHTGGGQLQYAVPSLARGKLLLEGVKAGAVPWMYVSKSSASRVTPASI